MSAFGRFVAVCLPVCLHARVFECVSVYVPVSMYGSVCDCAFLVCICDSVFLCFSMSMYIIEEFRPCDSLYERVCVFLFFSVFASVSICPCEHVCFRCVHEFTRECILLCARVRAFVFNRGCLVFVCMCL